MFEFFHFGFFFFFSSYYEEETKYIFLQFTIGNMHSQIELIISWFNLIFKHGKILAEGKRYEWRKERNIHINWFPLFYKRSIEL